MPKKISDLVHANIIHVGDTIYFTFKNNTFEANIAEHGFIHRVRHGSTPIFDARCFDSLTGWTEACIQDILQEYHTRYSSWRRVKHKKTVMTLDNLYKRLQKQQLEASTPMGQPRLQQLVHLQRQESCELKTRLEDAHTALNKWHEWWRKNNATPPPVEPVQHTPSPPPEPETPPETITVMKPSQQRVWNPPAAFDQFKVRAMDPSAVAAYTHAFFT
jgi:hypothetical protein